jgi:predicted nucleic acid-binding protein
VTKYLLDTNVLIELIRSDPKDTKIIFEKAGSQLYLPFIAAGELVQGARNKRELKQILSLIDTFQLDWGSITSTQRAFRLLTSHTLSNGMDLLDALIAAIALEHDYTLVTLNHKHFTQVGGLRVIAPSAINTDEKS